MSDSACESCGRDGPWVGYSAHWKMTLCINCLVIPDGSRVTLLRAAAVVSEPLF